MARDAADLAAQHECVRAKAELAKAKGLTTKSEQFIDALYYHEMYFSERRITTLSKVTAALKKLSSEAKRIEELKEQIRMRVLGLGWPDLHTPWSKGGEAFDSAHLKAHLATILTAEKTRPIPDKPPVPLLDRKALPQLGTATDAKLLLDQRAAEAAGGFEAAARAEKARREAAGIGDSHAERQPPVAPSVAAGTIVAGTRLEVLCHYNFAMAVEGAEGGLMWCSATVLSTEGVRKGPRSVYAPGEAALVLWDANDRVEPAEEPTEGAVELKPSLFNKEKEGAWRLDFDA